MRQSDDDIRDVAKKIANSPNNEKYEAFKAMADEDMTRIQTKLVAAEMMRQKMPEDKKREILG